MTANYIRGTNDARRYSRVEQTDLGWVAWRSDTSAPVWIIEPVERDYLQGLFDCGCAVRTCGDVLQSSAMDRLLSRVAWLMGTAQADVAAICPKRAERIRASCKVWPFVRSTAKRTTVF